MSTFDPSPHTCSECQEIVIDGTGPQVDWHREFSYHEVKHSQHCKFFSWTLSFPTTHLYETDKLRLYISDGSEDLEYLHIEWRDKDGNYMSEHDTKRQLYIFSREDDGAARYIKSRPLAQSPATSESLRRCLELYKRCLHHKECKKAMDGNKRNYMAPARLLDVRSNSQLHLYTVPEGEHPSYVALSYCWGTSQQQKDARTTRENADDRQGRIDISQLPQSIRDAIKVTQRLELSYLWVDAFCIIQNDRKDVESEMLKMASIYRGATITISAASASDSTEGFLKNRDLKKAYGNLFQLPYHNKRADGVVEGSVLLSEHPIADTRQENIDQRAWTLQEDMLSLRLLRFGSKQTTWRCPTYPQTKKIDGGGCPALKNKDYDFSTNDPHRNTEIRSNILAFGLSNDSYEVENWFNDIGEYTLRKLTNPDDRLPACAALAENFADIMNFGSSVYLAGLWEKSIHAHLLWYRPKERKAEGISGPSWSWASINGPIRFLGFKLSHLTPGDNVAKYVDSSMVYKSGNHKYSEVTEGRLELNGRRRYVYWDSRFLKRSSDDADVLPLKIYWDVADGNNPDKPEAQPMCCFEVFGSYRSFGLVLVIDEHTGFRRAGCFEDIEGASVMRSFFDETEPQNIVLY